MYTRTHTHTHKHTHKNTHRRPANSHSKEFYRESYDSHGFMANLDSPLHIVNMYKSYCNGVSNVDFLPQQTKNVAWCWKQSPNFAYRGRGLHVHDTKLCIRKLLLKRHRQALMRFLTLNRPE